MRNFIKKGLWTILFCLCFISSVYSATTQEIKQIIVKQARDIGVEPEIALSLAKVESGFRQDVKSSGGHIGIYQLSYQTAKNMGYDPYKLDDNIKAGLTYYKKMYDKFGSVELALAAYNSGPGAISRNSNKIPKNSMHFVSKIMHNYKHYKEKGL